MYPEMDYGLQQTLIFFAGTFVACWQTRVGIPTVVVQDSMMSLNGNKCVMTMNEGVTTITTCVMTMNKGVTATTEGVTMIKICVTRINEAVTMMNEGVTIKKSVTMMR